jgi:hypothetical protein
MVPDLAVSCREDTDAPVRQVLLEIKTLHYAPSTYTSSTQRCNAVARRAANVEVEYLRKARSLDQRWLGTIDGQLGPIELKLRSFGGVRGLVFGSWGEASEDVEWLLNQLADAGSYRHRLALQAATPQGAKATLIWLLQRRWGMAALRANARLLLERLGHVGRGATAAASRRSNARSEFSARAHLYASWASRGPRVWPRHRA